MSDDSYLPAENRQQNGACTEMRTTVLSVNNNDVKISKKCYVTLDNICFMQRTANVGNDDDDDDDFMRRNLDDRERFSINYILCSDSPIYAETEPDCGLPCEQVLMPLSQKLIAGSHASRFSCRRRDRAKTQAKSSSIEAHCK